MVKDYLMMSGAITALLLSWSGILFFIMKAKLRDDFLTKEAAAQQYMKKDEAFGIFISEKTHALLATSHKESIDQQFKSVHSELNGIKRILEKHFDNKIRN